MRVSYVAVLAMTIAGSGCGSTRPSNGTVTVSNIPLRYVREGSGPTAVAIGSAVYYPKAYSAALRKQLDMVFVDSRHFVPSYQPTADELAGISLETFADDLDAARQQLGIDRWAVLGHSIHAQIAIAYARKYPQHTTHLVIIGGVPSAFADFAAAADSFFQADASPERKDALATATRDLDRILAATPAARQFAVGYQHRAALYWTDPHYDATEVLSGLENGPAFDRLVAALPPRSQVREALQAIKIPTLVVHGKLDYAIPHFTWQPLVEGLPNVVLQVLDDESHNPQTEHPQRFDPILVKFLTPEQTQTRRVSSAAATQTAATRADTAAITGIRQQAEKAVNSGDTTLAYMADDVVIMPPNGPMIRGIADVRAWFKESLRQFRFSVAYTDTTVVFFGDWAIGRTAGTLTLTPVAGGPPIADVFKGMHVYRRDASGGWKLVQDVWNSDLPVAPRR